MNQEKSINGLIQQIEASQNFDALERYCDPQSWDKISQQDRRSLAKLFLKRGKIQLEQGDQSGVDSFKRALTLAGNDPFLLLEYARSWGKFTSNIRCLQEAANAYTNLLKSSPQLLEGWLELGEVLLELGVGTSSHQVLQESIHTFEHAELLAAEQNVLFPAKKFWQWGLAWHYQGKQSGEAHDMHQAVDKYLRASDAGLEDSLYFYDYAEALALMASLLKRDDLYLQSIEWFQKSVQLAPQFFDAWCELACAYKYLFEVTESDEYFISAEKTFLNAARINPSYPLLWLKWAELLTSEARLKHDPDLLQLSLQKFEKADVLEPNNALVLLRWADALLTLGSWEERLDYLQEAKDKIQQSLRNDSESVNAWWVFGNCLIELGNYFEDESYYLDAIKKFDYGITLNDCYPYFWIGLGSAYFSLGDLKDDIAKFELASECYGKAINCGGHLLTQLWNDWGVCLMKLAELKSDVHLLEAAVEKFELAISYRKEKRNHGIVGSPEVYYNYACALDFLGDIHEETQYYEKSIGILFQLVQQHPEYYNARYHLALALSHLGIHTGEVELLQKSLEQFNGLLETDPEDEVA